MGVPSEAQKDLQRPDQNSGDPFRDEKQEGKRDFSHQHEQRPEDPGSSGELEGNGQRFLHGDSSTESARLLPQGLSPEKCT